MNIMKLVLIEWEDSFGCSSSWEDIDTNKEIEPFMCTSVGWLFYDGKRCKTIIPHITEDRKQGCGDMTIPTSSIKRMVILVEKEDIET